MKHLFLGLAFSTTAMMAASCHAAPSTMRQVQKGDDGLKVVTAPVPEPGPNQLRLRVYASSVNPFELRMVRNIAETPANPRPAAPAGAGGPGAGGPPPGMANMAKMPGTDVAGIVDAVGPGVTGFKVGDKVFGAARVGGGWSEYALTPADQTALKPANITFEQATGIPTAGYAAWRVFKTAGVKPGDKVAIIGAAGGVGTVVTQLARDAGGKVIGVASSRQEDYLKGLGVSEFVPYDKVNVAERVKGVDVVINTARGQSDTAVHYLRPGGRFASIAENASAEACAAAKAVCATEQRGASPDTGAGEAFKQLAALAGRDKLDLAVEKSFPLDQVDAALDALQAGHTQGKIALDVTPQAKER